MKQKIRQLLGRSFNVRNGFGLADQIYAVKRGKVVYESKKSTIDKSKLRTSVGV